MKKNELDLYHFPLLKREESSVGPIVKYQSKPYEECEKENLLGKFLKGLLIAAAVASVVLLLGIATHGRFFNFIFYLLLLGLSLSLALFIPMFIAECFAMLYCLIDKNPERQMWVGSTIRFLGFLEGARNIYHNLHDHPGEPYRRHCRGRYR